MLSSTVEDIDRLRFPLLVSPKLDGIRCCIVDGEAVTRNLKAVPNAHVRATLKGLPPFDGELIGGDPTAPDVWNKTSSAVMSRDGTPAFTFYVFDMTTSPSVPFEQRLDWVRNRAKKYAPHVVALPHNAVNSIEELMQYEAAFNREGYEGAMLRKPDGYYKYGRATWNERLLMKMKRFEDYEAKVVAVTERMHNANTATVNALGLTERSSHKGNLVGTGALGALVCELVDAKGAVEFEIGTGFTEAQRKELWDGKLLGKSVGKIAKFKCQGFTPDGKPRFPVFLGFRDKRDMS